MQNPTTAHHFHWYLSDSSHQHLSPEWSPWFFLCIPKTHSEYSTQSDPLKFTSVLYLEPSAINPTVTHKTYLIWPLLPFRPLWLLLPDINSSTVTPISFSVYLNYAKHTSASGPLHFILLCLKCSLTFFTSLLKSLSQIAHFPPAAFFFLALITIQHIAILIVFLNMDGHFYQYCSLLYFQWPEQCLAQKRYSINI